VPPPRALDEYIQHVRMSVLILFVRLTFKRVGTMARRSSLSSRPGRATSSYWAFFLIGSVDVVAASASGIEQAAARYTLGRRPVNNAGSLSGN
jgi:hypothetical protein